MLYCVKFFIFSLAHIAFNTTRRGEKISIQRQIHTHQLIHAHAYMHIGASERKNVNTFFPNLSVDVRGRTD